MRCYILKVLLQKEALRHSADRSGLSMALVLVLAATVLAMSGKVAGLPFLSGQVACCYVDYWQDGPWIAHLRRHVPPELAVHFRSISEVAAAGETICYPPNAGAIQIRAAGDGKSGPICKIWVWYPGPDQAALAPFESWFWQESTRYFRAASAPETGSDAQRLTWPGLEVEHSSLSGTADMRTTAAMGLVLFAIYFPCVYLLPSWACEERERGLLAALALTPATPLEIQTARALFYGLLAAGLAVLVTALTGPLALCSSLYWASLFIAVLGALGIGSTLTCLVRTQRRAGFASLSYMLGVALIISASQRMGVSGMPRLVLESHLPPMLSAAFSGTVEPGIWIHALSAAVLALTWLLLALSLFRRRGWNESLLP